MLIANGDVQVDSAFRRLKPQHDRFRVGRPLQSGVHRINFGRMDSEFEAIVIQLCYGIPNHHVSQLANRLARRFFRKAVRCARNIGSRLLCRGHLHVENDAPFDLAANSDQSGDACSFIVSFFHGDIGNFRGASHGFRDHRVQGVDERLHQFHFHDWTSPAVAGVCATVSFST